jgi:hypothetical protein
MLPRKKIYIDSRFKSNDSISDSNFKIILDSTIQLPENCAYIINDIAISNVFRTIETNINDKLYLQFYMASSTPPVNLFSIITLPSSIYNGFTLATMIQDILNEEIKDIYYKLVQRNFQLWTFKCTYTELLNEFKISATLHPDMSPNNTWRILTDYEINSNPNLLYSGFINPGNYDANNLASFNFNIKNIDFYSTPFKNNEVYICPFLDLHSIKNIYIYTSLGNFESLSPSGVLSNISRKICVNSDYGYLITNNIAETFDALDCSRKTISFIDIKICNTRGIEIPMYKQTVSFSIVFIKTTPEQI